MFNIYDSIGLKATHESRMFALAKYLMQYDQTGRSIGLSSEDTHLKLDKAALSDLHREPRVMDMLIEAISTSHEKEHKETNAFIRIELYSLKKSGEPQTFYLRVPKESSKHMHSYMHHLFIQFRIVRIRDIVCKYDSDEIPTLKLYTARRRKFRLKHSAYSYNKNKNSCVPITDTSIEMHSPAQITPNRVRHLLIHLPSILICTHKEK